MNNKIVSPIGMIIFLLTLAMLIGAIFGFWMGSNSQADAKLSDDTLKEVERLRVKYFFDGLEITELISIGHASTANSDIVWTRDFLHLEVEGDKLIVETQDGKWFIEMEKVK